MIDYSPTIGILVDALFVALPAGIALLLMHDGLQFVLLFPPGRARSELVRVPNAILKNSGSHENLWKKDAGSRGDPSCVNAFAGT